MVISPSTASSLGIELRELQMTKPRSRIQLWKTKVVEIEGKEGDEGRGGQSQFQTIWNKY